MRSHEPVPARPGPTVITPRRAIITALLGLALFLFVFAFTLGGGDEQQPGRAGEDAVERFLPAAGATLELRQTQIGLDLAPGWAAALQVEGVEIPPDQINCFDDCFDPRPGVDPQGIVFFVPGPGKVVERLPPGRRCATAHLWRPVSETRESDGRPVTWCFRVV
ncbi:MAG: hypothetical protein ACRDZ9_05215 [Acidimicrobiales bacterium]